MAFYTGQLLIATPRLLDPNFARGVILLLDHDDDGALGVVINRPSGIPLRAVLPDWSDVVSEPSMLFAGGPVGVDSALAVGLSYAEVAHDGFTLVAGNYGLVDLEAEPEAVAGGLVGLRVFSGYAGWGDGQLESEIDEGSWYVAAAADTDLLSPAPERLWRSVLRRQPGELGYLATFPDDPSMN